jgi:hypothetical protein
VSEAHAILGRAIQRMCDHLVHDDGCRQCDEPHLAEVVLLLVEARRVLREVAA